MKYQPLLFIRTPSYAVAFPDPEQHELEESTSIYEMPHTHSKTTSLIAHQLRYFASSGAKNRVLLVLLKNGERLVGTIEHVNGTDVVMKVFEQKTVIAVNDIAAIHTSR